MHRPTLALAVTLSTLPAAGGCVVRDLAGAEVRQGAPSRPVVTPAPWQHAQNIEQGAAAVPTKSQVITGTVRGRTANRRFALRALAETPVEGAQVRLGRLDNPRGEGTVPVTTAGNGRYRLEHDRLGRPLFVRATWTPPGAGPITLDAPVPMVSAREISVDVDLVSHLMTQYILDRAASPQSLANMLTPTFLSVLRGSISAGLTEANAPDVGAPSEALAAAQRLVEAAPQASAVLAALPSLPPVSPLPSGLTVVPPDLSPGPTNSDPPALEIPEGPSSGPPRWARYLGSDTTGLAAPISLACAPMEGLEDVLLAGLDGRDGDIFLYLRDSGGPGTVAATDIPASGAVAVALDGKKSLFVAAKRRLVRVTLQVRGERPTFLNANVLLEAEADLTALAADPARVVVALADGRLLRFDLLNGQLEGAFSVRLPGPAAALALDQEGGGVALLAGSGSFLRFSGSGGPPGSPIGSLAGASMLTGLVGEGVLAAARAGTVWNLGQALTPAALALEGETAAIARLGGYLFRLDPGGNLDTLTLPP